MSFYLAVFLILFAVIAKAWANAANANAAPIQKALPLIKANAMRLKLAIRHICPQKAYGFLPVNLYAISRTIPIAPTRSIVTSISSTSF